MFFPVPPNPSGDTAPAPQPDAAASPDEVRDLRAVAGSNADYFMLAWGRVLAGRPGPVGFSLPSGVYGEQRDASGSVTARGFLLGYGQTALTCFTGNAKDGPKDWNVNGDAHITAVLANKQKVATTFGYNTINETDVKAVVAALKKALEEKK